MPPARSRGGETGLLKISEGTPGKIPGRDSTKVLCAGKLRNGTPCQKPSGNISDLDSPTKVSDGTPPPTFAFVLEFGATTFGNLMRSIPTMAILAEGTL